MESRDTNRLDILVKNKDRISLLIDVTSTIQGLNPRAYFPQPML
jgi:hypothetical protein